MAVQYVKWEWMSANLRAFRPLGGISISISQTTEYSSCRTVQYTVHVPRAQKKKTKRAAGSPATLTQLVLCLRLAYDV